ncbi:hypothetical protein ACK32R_04235 [Aeromonas dhakensis]|uniref:hypothetical protein n=1 Tax=Aeromonas dhakensis TaxID=196024 RepID=UPI003986CD95
MAFFNDAKIALFAQKIISKELKPPYVGIDDDLMRHQLQDLLSGLKFQKAEMAILDVLFVLTPDVYSADEISEKANVKSSTVARLLKRMSDTSILQLDKIRVGNSGRGRSCNLFVLKNPTMTGMKLIQKNAQVSEENIFMSYHKGANANLVALPEYAILDDLICGAIAPSLPLNRQKNASIHSKLTWKGRQLNVHMMSTHTCEGAEYDDLKTYVAILSCCERIVQQLVFEGKPVSETFVIKLVDILSARGHTSKAGKTMRDSLRGSLDRLRHTKFDITEDLGQHKSYMYSEDDEPLKEIVPITNVSYYFVDGIRNSKAAAVEFQLPLFMVNALKIGNSKLFTKESLNFFKEDIILTVLHRHLEFYLDFTSETTIQLSWEKLKELVSQPSSMRALKKRFYSAIKEHVIGEVVSAKSECIYKYKGIIGYYAPDTKCWKFSRAGNIQIADL